jgi:hypothetical protein
MDMVGLFVVYKDGKLWRGSGRHSNRIRVFEKESRAWGAIKARDKENLDKYRVVLYVPSILPEDYE